MHDPLNPAIEVLQEPSEALGVLVPDGAGNQVDWVQSLQQGLIAPRPSLSGNREPEIRDTTVLMKNTYPMLYVRFPLSLRNVEDLLHERGIDISHETVRFWWNRFGPLFAAEIRKKRVSQMRAYANWQWHLDKVL